MTMTMTALPVNFEGIPLELRKIPRWVLWRFVQVGDKWSKLPMQANNKAASSTNPSTWTDYLSAEEAYKTGRFDGIGLVFDGTDGLIGIDVDDCRDEAGELTQLAKDIMANVKGYAEVSPSGTGIKVFSYGDLKKAITDHGKGLELYPRGRYFTVTGHQFSPDHVRPERTDVSLVLPFFDTSDEHVAVTNIIDDPFALVPLPDWDIVRVEELLKSIDPNCSHHEWITVGMALHHQFGGDVEALDLWDRWSYAEGNCSQYIEGECRKRWPSFASKGGAYTLKSLIWKANQAKRIEAVKDGSLIVDNGPMNHARAFLEHNYETENGYTIVHYGGDWYIHREGLYEPVEDDAVKKVAYLFFDKCKKWVKVGKEMQLVPYAPNRSNISETLEAAKSLTLLENRQEVRPPLWLEGYGAGKPPSAEIISLENGLFHVDSNVLMPHDQGFFALNKLPFSYSPEATCPHWMQFLSDIFDNDSQSIQLLQEWFGYCLTPDTRQQKMLFVIGPRRSGKGTINKILTALLGTHNTVAPQLEELNDTFGLQPWIGKLLASFTDARVPERNRSGIVQNLLRIVGGDATTVNRKNREAWNGYLPTRIAVYSNEMLMLGDSSNALTGRMLTLQMTRSFFGKEDTELDVKLLQELPGIFLWALDGLRNRRARPMGKFIQPESSKNLLDDMADANSPVSAFGKVALVIEHGATVQKDDVFHAYRLWCNEQNRQAGNEFTFKRAFQAAYQTIVTEHRSTYCNVRLRKIVQDTVDQSKLGQSIFSEEHE
jgi:putative DNA primase/helicase